MKNKKKQQQVSEFYLIQISKQSRKLPIPVLLVFITVVGVLGFIFITVTYAAARKYVSLEAENATISGNVTTKTDSNAAGGKSLQFDSPPAPPAPDEANISGWGLPFYRDEFSGSSVDTSRWGVYHNNYGSGNNELECNTPNNVAVSGGALTITGKKQTYSCPVGGTKNYTSGFLGSRDASTARYYPLYGRFEMRAKVPHGQGLWPAFWLRHKNGASTAEVDIVELFHNQAPGKVTHTLHFPASIGANVSKKSTSFETAVQGTGNWHTFAVEIVPAGTNSVKFTFFVDGTQTHTYTNTNAASWVNGYENEAWDIAVNLAIGGNWVGHPDQQLGYLPYPNKCSITYTTPAGGDPTTCSTTGIWFANMASRDAVYQIDYVRMWKYQ